MKDDEKLGYLEGFADGTLGSCRPYNRRDLKRRIEMMRAVIRDDRSNPIFQADKKRQGYLDKQIHAGKAQTEAIYGALNDLMDVLGLQGESGTERLMVMLDNVLPKVFNEAAEGHKDGLFTDNCYVLADLLASDDVIEPQPQLVQ